jgi:nitroreductase
MAEFTREEIDALYRVMTARRDMRHFSGEPIDPALRARLFAAAHMAPSVAGIVTAAAVTLPIDRIRFLRHLIAPRDKFPSRGFKGNSGSIPGLPPQL